ncbi:hypothetical protein [Pseudophaeobacter sp.]|uniref:hypothetical protein n=1 Tax=Pseudophaeobacter sp. TaxID=1971739 RepID=UPI0040582C51
MRLVFQRFVRHHRNEGDNNAAKLRFENFKAQINNQVAFRLFLVEVRAIHRGFEGIPKRRFLIIHDEWRFRRIHTETMSPAKRFQLTMNRVGLNDTFHDAGTLIALLSFIEIGGIHFGGGQIPLRADIWETTTGLSTDVKRHSPRPHVRKRLVIGLNLVRPVSNLPRSHIG